MTAFAQPIDAETWAFIERTNAHYPPETIDSTIAEQRAVYDRMCPEFFAGYPAEVTANDSFIDTPGHKVPIRVYAAGRGGEGADGQAAGTEASARHGTSTQAAGLQASVPAATVLYFHGGGFVVGGLDSHDDVCAELCGRTGYAVVSVDYRLAPEHAHPAQFDDAMAAFGWVLAAYEGAIVLAGDSAGGNLAAAVSHAARQRSTRMPAGQVLIYPGLGGDETKGSYITHAEAPMLTARDVAYYRELRAGGADVAADASFAPLADNDFSGLPPTVIVTAQCDPLSSDGETYRNRIIATGGLAFWREEPGLVHGYLRARHSVERARQSFAGIVQAVSALGRREWPY